MVWKRIFLAVIVIGLLAGCVTQKPDRIYNLTVYISGGADNCVEIHTEALVDRAESVDATQNIKPDTTIKPF